MAKRAGDRRISKKRKTDDPAETDALEVILESDWTNCKDIYYEARKRDPNLGMATVYRTVSALEEMGVLGARTSTPHRIRQRRKRIVNSNHLCLIDHYFRVWHQKLYEASGFRLLRIVREKSPKRIKVKDKDLSHYPHQCTMKVDGMSCGNCAVRVENVLNAMEGVWARVDLEAGEAQVYMKQKYEDKALKDAVKAAGYTIFKINHTK